ncbi:insulinase family protein [Jeotgalibaca sp. MA1X17-3]|uniref:EF-P 5-aminopentanol modification-associated protein YfmF n=1 Tax=Jeotgalibaca sp. MA1X17-3 TaxID=2908211 RepID=UPI001F4609C0|nr:pitrilysin family protein [Jeotgalibaca sp. MA1X17-3]UJF14875.1 insulinase family protein [Jeotgalibaca sp. MA1X17-3]
MEVKLATGVNAFINPTEKFKTVIIEYKFRSLYDPKKATARTLLRNVLITNTKKHSTQKEMDQQMSWLYGASLSSNSQRIGKQHIVTVSLKIVNDKFIGGDDSLLEQAFAFLNEVVFSPNIEDGQFHSSTFSREKQNLKNQFQSLEDNKTRYASVKLNEMLFEGTDQAYLGMGDEKFLDEMTPASLFVDYTEMIEKNQIDILVSGDVDSNRVKDSLEQLQLKEREKKTEGVFVSSTTKELVNEKEEISVVNQATLMLGFSSPAYYMEKEYFASMVFNGLFGGFPHSKLFQNVREKASLAYSTSSFIDFLRGTMVVYTGIESTKKQEVEEIVLKQLEDMRAGDFIDELIVQTKDMLINQFMQNDDHQSASLSKVYMNRLTTGRDIKDEEWISSLQSVTKAEIIEVANQMKLQATFFLKGEQVDA